MTDTRDFPTAVIASLSSGINLCSFNEMHNAAEYLMGHPIWTHHFASKDLWQDMQRTVLAQCPGMPTKLPGITKGNYQECIADLELKFGKTTKIRKGSGLTAMLPTDGIPDIFKDTTVVIKI